jgi:hypothetical protein
LIAYAAPSVAPGGRPSSVISPAAFHRTACVPSFSVCETPTMVPDSLMPVAEP